MLGRPAKIKLIRDTMVLPPPYDKDESWRADEPLYRAALSLKLFEEAAEVAADPSDVDEYADLLDVLATMAEVNGIPWVDVLSAMYAKRGRRGGFTEGRVGLHTYPDKEDVRD
jgi:predicted house-cleaning noncanonical NTP pyrophosphatase (MazG superfamily)